jgi:hypothetical protein
MQNCILQVDQYITKPGKLLKISIQKLLLKFFSVSGQAAAYKIGEKKIHELRKKFEAKDGREYNLVIPFLSISLHLLNLNIYFTESFPLAFAELLRTY